MTYLGYQISTTKSSLRSESRSDPRQRARNIKHLRCVLYRQRKFASYPRFSKPFSQTRTHRLLTLSRCTLLRTNCTLIEAISRKIILYPHCVSIQLFFPFLWLFYVICIATLFKIQGQWLFKVNVRGVICFFHINYEMTLYVSILRNNYYKNRPWIFLWNNRP